MALPLILPALPAIAKGAAALSAALGATAVMASKKNEDSNLSNISEELKNAFIQQNMPLMIATNVIKSKMQQPVTKNIPTAENALVLRPEYRTITTPIEYIGYRPLFNSTDVANENGSSQTGTTEQQSSTPSPNQSEDPKDDDKKPKDDAEDKLSTNKSQSAIKRGWNKQGLTKIENPTWSQQWSRAGQNIAYWVGRSARFVSSPGFVLPVATVVGTPLGGYWALRDNNADKANQIDTVATRKHNTHRLNVVEIVE